MAEVFLCATGQLDDRSRRELRKAGVVVVEVEDPTSCQFIRSTEIVSGDDMLWAALDALRSQEGYSAARDQRERFALNVWRLVDAARSAEGKVSTKKAAPAP